MQIWLTAGLKIMMVVNQKGKLLSMVKSPVNFPLCPLCNLNVLCAPKKVAQSTLRLHKGHNGTYCLTIFFIMRVCRLIYV
jgi:hypothetical protein